MRDLAGFREAVRGYRRAVGCTQQQLARAIGLHPDVLSHKINGRDHAVLTTADTTAIVTTLARWAALRTRAEAERVLELMDVPPHAIPADAWAAPPLAALIPDGPASDGRPAVAPSPHRPAAASPVEPELRAAAPPLAPTPLVGRHAELEAIRAALEGSRLVTLTGVGGAGKTRLAIQTGHELADHYADGVAFADLAAVHEPKLLAIVVARSLGLRPASADTAEELLVQALHGQHALLVLDNLEQLLGAVPLLGRLLSGAPRLRILATSRIPLRLYGETVLRVPPLGLRDADGPAGSEAVQLFVQRARAARADFTAEGGDLAAIAAICAALDGLPLAIELAAARVKIHPPPALLALLGDRLSVLTGGPRDLPHRQQTLRATLDWSYMLLDEPGRRMFACLGVFAGPFDAAAAAAAGENAEGTLRQLEALCDQSLIEAVPGAPPRFRLLETVREYALARLAETGRRDAVFRRHLDHYLAMATTRYAAAAGPEQRAGLDDLEAAYPNIRAAFDFAHDQARHDAGCLDAGLRLAITFSALWERRLSLAEGAWQLDRLLALDSETHAASRATRAHALIEQSALECWRGHYTRAIALAKQGRTLCRALDDHNGQARAHRFIGESVLATGDYVAAEPHFRRQLTEAEQAGDRRAQAAAYNMLGQVARHHGRYAEATTLLHRALQLSGRAHDPDGVGTAINSLGEVARDAGQADRARRLFTASLRRHRQLGSTRGVAYDLEGLAAAAGLHGDGQKALTYLGAAQTLRERSGGPLPPIEQAILTCILTSALARLTPEEHDRALTKGRSQPLADTLTDAEHGGDQIWVESG